MKNIIFIVLMFLSLCSISLIYTNEIMTDFNKNIVRLHILAQSDSEYDQEIKLEVRNEILKAVKNIDIKNTSEFLKTAQRSANEYLSRNNIDYKAKAESGNFYFPRKNYNHITLPEGRYNGIRVILGKGNGANWWCIMYPPLCIDENGQINTDIKTELKLKNSLKPDTYEIITDKSDKIKIKFKTIEIINKMKKKIVD